MYASHPLRRSVLVFCLLIAAVPVFAQTTQDTKQIPFQPQVGQGGKDVVWVPTPQALVDKMLDMAKVTPQDFLMDLGSGDGRTVITAARRGARALGIEYNPDLLPEINLKLRPTILDLKPGTRVVSNTFTMEDWNPDETATVEEGCTSWCTALLWIVPAKAAGVWTWKDGELTLTQEFQMVSGALRSGAASMPIVNGRLRGDRISFTVGGTTYAGKVNGTAIDGTATTGATSVGWSATKGAK